MLFTVYNILLSALLVSVSAQWHHDVMNSDTTCENLMIAYPSCLHSARCISDYFLECKCVPRVLKEMFDYSMGAVDGHTLCLYTTFTLGVGEPRCCDFYKRGIFLDQPDYSLAAKGNHFPNQVGTRSSESTSGSSQVTRETEGVDTVLPESPLVRLLDYGKELYDDTINETSDSAVSNDNGLKVRGSKRASSRNRSLIGRNKLISALRCFNDVQNGEGREVAENGYDCFMQLTKD